MKITEITYSMSLTKQIADYEPMNVHYSMKAEVAENDWKTSLRELREKVKAVISSEEKVMDTYKAIRSKKSYGASSARELDEAEKEFSKSLDLI